MTRQSRDISCSPFRNAAPDDSRNVHQALPIFMGLLLAILVLVSPAASSAPEEDTPTPETPAARAFERFKALEGDWEGTTNRGEAIVLSYQVVAEGTAVLERERVGGEGPDGTGGHEMLTLYHLDGDRLVLTHYCAAGNQPRMVAQVGAVGAASESIRFELADVTGLESPDSGHMHRAVFDLQDRDRLRSAWTWRESGEDAFTVEVDARRVPGSRRLANR